MIIKKIINKISSYIYRISVLCKYKRKLSKSISFSDCKLLNEVNSTQRIAIHFHIFYIDLLDEIYTYIAHIKNPFTLYLTVVNEEDYIKTQKGDVLIVARTYNAAIQALDELQFN